MRQMIDACQIQWPLHLTKVREGELVECNGWQEEVDAGKAQDKIFEIVRVDELGFTEDQKTEEADRIQQLKSCVCAH